MSRPTTSAGILVANLSAPQPSTAGSLAECSSQVLGTSSHQPRGIGRQMSRSVSATTLSTNGFSTGMEDWLKRGWSGTAPGVWDPYYEPPVSDTFASFDIILERGLGSPPVDSEPLEAKQPLPAVCMDTRSLKNQAEGSAVRALDDVCSSSDLQDASATLAGLRELSRLLRLSSEQAPACQADPLAAVDLRRELDDYAVTELLGESSVEIVLRIMRLPPGWSGLSNEADGVDLEAAVLDAAADVVALL
eukprot:TRINITY_DN61862_c0_g1_i1.p1 TRINITY_DN61862_c0_g1~~TRINITY_DN61862_c0_g1_i1.p1  ORF type:complete len:248 (-),score=34.16 TRINITY_DN61862_c0_g1_i1:143-886(-)